MDDVDVVVVGAGPVGLLTAIELGLGGVSVLVLERLAAPSTALKAGGIGPLGLEALRRRGMADAIAAAEARSAAAMGSATERDQLFERGRKYSGHFAGLALIRTDAQKEPERRGGRVDQQAVEAMLADRASSLGIEVRRDCDVTGLVRRTDGVEVAWASASGAGHVRCSYLVGCDGGRSSIRGLAGFAFPGWDPTLTMYQVVAEIDHPERLSPGGFRHTSGGMFLSFSDRLILIDFSGPPEDRRAPITHQELEAVLRRVSRADVRIKAFENASRWTDNTRLVESYRRDRVLLAGDAAHIHSPFGGQGLSLGLLDAANLGWKLAAVVRGDMPASLLDTYTTERRPAAEAVLANTLAQVAIMRPDPQSGAMRNLVAKLMQVDGAHRFFGEVMSSLYVRYDLGSNQGDLGRLIGDTHVGHCGADRSLFDIMQDGSGVLLDASSEAAASRLVAASTRRIPSTRRIRCVAVASGPSMLIRPDACVAWTEERNSTDGLKEALRRWFVPTLGDAPAQAQR